MKVIRYSPKSVVIPRAWFVNDRVVTTDSLNYFGLILKENIILELHSM